MPLHGFLSLLAAAALCGAGEANAVGGCAFPLGTRFEDPLLTWPGGGWVYPDGDGTVSVEEGAEILVECLGEGNSVVLREDTGSRSGAENGVNGDKDAEVAAGGSSGEFPDEDGGLNIAERTEETGNNGGSGYNSGEKLGDGSGIEGGSDRVRRNSDNESGKSGASGRIEDGNGESGGLGSSGGVIDETGDDSETRDEGENRRRGERAVDYGYDEDSENSRDEGSEVASVSGDKRDNNDIHVMGNGSRPGGNIDISGTELKVACVDGRHFSIGEHVVNITNLKCRKSPRYSYEFPKVTTATETTETFCGGQRRSELFQLGFPTSAGFLEMIEICFDTDTLTPVYTKHLVPREIKGRRSSKGQSWFRVGPKFRGMNPTKYYKAQRTSLKSLNVSYSPGQFLNRGHLSPRGDFIQVPQQRATYIYENTAPQWASFNAGDWEKLERSVRNLAAARRNLTVITGTYGTATLKNSENKDVFIYLNRGRRHKNMTVPAVFWKVVIDPDTLEGIAVLGANKPRDDDVCQPAWPCEENMCVEVKWFVRRGQFHCCSVENMQRYLQLLALRNLPPLKPLTTLTPLTKVQSSVVYSVNIRGRA